MLPRLQADERLAAIADQSVASGSVDRDTQKRAVGDLERTRAGAAAVKTKASPASLAAMGIGVVVPQARPKEPSDEVLSDG